MSVVLYGIVRSGHRLPEPAPMGIGHPAGPVRLVRDGPLAAVASDTAELGAVGEHEALQHLDILQRLLADGPVLPLRLGTVAPSEDAVREEVLDTLGEYLPERLDAVAGRVELQIDVDEDEDTALAAVLPGSPLAGITPPEDLDGRIRLGEQIGQLLVEHRVRVGNEILDALRPLAESDQPRGSHGGVEDPVLRWAFLVRAEAVDEFDQAVADLRRRYPDLAIDYVGPLPAVHFVAVPAHAPAGAGEAADSFGGSGQWGWGSEADQPEQG